MELLCGRATVDVWLFLHWPKPTLVISQRRFLAHREIGMRNVVNLNEVVLVRKDGFEMFWFH